METVAVDSVETPEHDKLMACKEQAEAISKFLEWLGGAGVVLADNYKGLLIPTLNTPRQLVMAHLGIDTVALRHEAWQMEWALRASVEKGGGEPG